MCSNDEKVLPKHFVSLQHRARHFPFQEELSTAVTPVSCYNCNILCTSKCV